MHRGGTREIPACIRQHGEARKTSGQRKWRNKWQRMQMDPTIIRQRQAKAYANCRQMRFSDNFFTEAWMLKKGGGAICIVSWITQKRFSDNLCFHPSFADRKCDCRTFFCSSKLRGGGEGGGGGRGKNVGKSPKLIKTTENHWKLPKRPKTLATTENNQKSSRTAENGQSDRNQPRTTEINFQKLFSATTLIT